MRIRQNLVLAQSSLKHVVLITLFSVAITHSCFTWVALTVAAFLRYLIPPQTTRSEIRLKLTAERGLKSAFTHSKLKSYFGKMLVLIFSVYSVSSLDGRSCEDIKCQEGRKCLWDKWTARGRCVVCEDTCPESRPGDSVCASDNATYPSDCAMRQAACSLGLVLEVKHSGSCNCK